MFKKIIQTLPVLGLLLLFSTGMQAQVPVKIDSKIKQERKDGRLFLSSAKPMKVVFKKGSAPVSIGTSAIVDCVCDDADKICNWTAQGGCSGPCCGISFSYGNSTLRVPGGGGGLTIIVDDF